MQASDSDINPYLQQEVLGASPIRLRLMLITRAEELCPLVEHLWDIQDDSQAQGWMLRIREILGELLSGVRDASNPVSSTVADFYVFLLKLVTQVEADRDVAGLQQIKNLLAIESETWRQVLRREMSGEMRPETPQPGLGGQQLSHDAPPPHIPSQYSFQSSSENYAGGSLSIEA